jgi:hypothetical protein
MSGTRACVSFISAPTDLCYFGQIDIGHSLGKPFAIKMNLSKAHITCNETITYAAAGVLFAWEPYAMTVTADRAHSSKEALAMKHTYMYMLGTCPASRSCSLACLSIVTAILPLSRSHAAVARRQENVPASEIPAGLACSGLPAVERLELAPYYAAEVCCLAVQRKNTARALTLIMVAHHLFSAANRRQLNRLSGDGLDQLDKAVAERMLNDVHDAGDDFNNWCATNTDPCSMRYQCTRRCGVALLRFLHQPISFIMRSADLLYEWYSMQDMDSQEAPAGMRRCRATRVKRQ